MIRINIIAWHNGGGLSRDVDIIIAALPKERFTITLNGAPVEQAEIRRQRIIHRAFNQCQLWRNRRKPPASLYDINLFLEDITPGFCRHAKTNVFIPNPEWFRKSQYRYLDSIDVVLSKTKNGQQIFTELGCQTQFVSFTSEDRFNPKIAAKKQPGFLHLAGRSWQKGTKALTDLWLQHPDWPLLTVVQSPKTYSQSRVKPIHAPNIKHMLERPNDATLLELQNTYSIHLSPSEAEGFGHCIAEAMSCRALTLTTDAPPMNELITSDRGILVDYHTSRTQRSGMNYYVDPVDLEQKIEAILTMDQSSIDAIGERARQWYEDNDRLFRSRFVAALEEALTAHAPRQRV